MKLISILIFLSSISCSSLISNQDEIERLTSRYLKNELSKKELRQAIIKLGYLDVEIGMTKKSISYMDSIVEIFVEKGTLFGRNAKFYLYDFSAKPRNIGSQVIQNASYKRIQVSERWYIEEYGFD